MEYFILKPNGEQTGTYSLDQIRDMLKTGVIGLDTRYWHEGIPDWQPIERIEGSVHFPEPRPEQPKVLPPPHQWSGSLARAIPSPYQLKKRSGLLMPGTDATPAPAIPAAPAVPVIPAPHRPAIAKPQASTGADAQNHVRRTPARAVDFSGDAERPTARRTWLLALGLFLLSGAIIAAIVESRHPAKSALSHVVVNVHNNCVLTDQTAIKPLEDDMRNAPVIARLRELIAKSTDPAFRQSAAAGLQSEVEKHEREVTEKYLDAGRAEFVAPGIYDAIAYLDDTGALIPAGHGDPWAAFTYRGAVVYTYIGGDFRLLAPQPVKPASP